MDRTQHDELAALRPNGQLDAEVSHELGAGAPPASTTWPAVTQPSRVLTRAGKRPASATDAWAVEVATPQSGWFGACACEPQPCEQSERALYGDVTIRGALGPSESSGYHFHAREYTADPHNLAES